MDLARIQQALQQSKQQVAQSRQIVAQSKRIVALIRASNQQIRHDPVRKQIRAASSSPRASFLENPSGSNR